MSVWCNKHKWTGYTINSGCPGCWNELAAERDQAIRERDHSRRECDEARQVANAIADFADPNETRKFFLKYDWLGDTPVSEGQVAGREEA